MEHDVRDRPEAIAKGLLQRANLKEPLDVEVEQFVVAWNWLESLVKGETIVISNKEFQYLHSEVTRLQDELRNLKDEDKGEPDNEDRGSVDSDSHPTRFGSESLPVG